MPAPKDNKFAKGNRGGGRKAQYKDDYARQGYEAACIGATDKDIAKIIGVAVGTVDKWKRQFEEFRLALKKGKDEHDTNLVEASLRDRALGFDYTEEAVTKMGIVEVRKRHTGDTTAAIFWLKNRQPDRWRDKQVTEHEGSTALENLSDEELEARLAALEARRAG